MLLEEGIDSARQEEDAKIGFAVTSVTQTGTAGVDRAHSSVGQTVFVVGGVAHLGWPLPEFGWSMAL